MYIYAYNKSNRINVSKNISIYDLLRFLRISHINIYFGLKSYGCPDISVRIRTDNESNKIYGYFAQPTYMNNDK